ncbi:glycoside hydrolase family 6 protein [Streptomyces atratus]|uniref:glycoside hydrolase family 6 protein n=1 Tax=Streptomyces atratus TaxID=1893 RepID=UPI0033FA06E1
MRGARAPIRPRSRQPSRGDATRRHAVPVPALCTIPGRDCATYSAGGASDTAEYKAWIDAVTRGIGSHDARPGRRVGQAEAECFHCPRVRRARGAHGLRPSECCRTVDPRDVRPYGHAVRGSPDHARCRSGVAR